jgi:hypothetical protein
VVLVPDTHDHANAVTRFVVVNQPGPLPAATGSDRTSLVAFLREDHPGALMEILTEFAVRGINLIRIESRPTGDGLGKYYFSIDCEGHVDDARVGEALMGLRRVCAGLRRRAGLARPAALTLRCPFQIMNDSRGGGRRIPRARMRARARPVPDPGYR